MVYVAALPITLLPIKLAMMEILNPDISLGDFFESLASASEKILMLDYDGTLAPFVEEREKAVPYPGIRKRLKKLIASADTRMVIVSGRAVADLMPLIGIDPLPEIWGCHGGEKYKQETGSILVDISISARDGLEAIKDWGVEASFSDRMEEKPTGIAFHWRGRKKSEISRMNTEIETAWRVKSIEYGLEMIRFDGGLEFRVKDVTKARAVSSILDQVTDDSVLAYLGDDYTDEDAFRAIGNRGLKVLVRQQKRATLADIWLAPPDDLYLFLDRYLDMLV